MRSPKRSTNTDRWAEISEDGSYRYVLGRRWDESLPECVFIMLNPSTADGTQDDPTIRRCMSFAQKFGCGSVLVGNLYAFRATAPADLWRADEPTGGDRNTQTLTKLLNSGSVAISAWGAYARQPRVDEVLQIPGADRLMALGFTESGAPRHPLYVRGDAELQSRLTPL
jgi:hypothetical protein